MFLTEKEIKDTPNALERTCRYFREHEKVYTDFFIKHPERKFVFMGCGSSFMLAKGAAVLFSGIQNTQAYAIAAGDYMLHPEIWEIQLKDAIVISISRSGRTSELVKSVKCIREALGCPIISVSAEEDNEIMKYSQLDITLEWCYDKSVCQTRTVTNFYAATLLLASIYRRDNEKLNQVYNVCLKNQAFQEKNQLVLNEIASMPWNQAVVLADGALCGIAEEAALAFMEISMVCGRYYHVLDYRHGPIVISNEETLTLIVLTPGEEQIQKKMVEDIVSHGGIVVTISEKEGNPWGGTANIQIEDVKEVEAWGIPFISVAQMLSLRKAELLGKNPDLPDGLDAYITLEEVQ